MYYFDNPGGMIPTWLINWAAKVGLQAQKVRRSLFADHSLNPGGGERRIRFANSISA